MAKKNLRILLISLCIWTFPAVSSAKDVAMITHKSTQETFVDERFIKNVYLGKKTRWPNGEPLEFVTLKSGTVHKKFLKKYIHLTPLKFKLYWKKRVFTGKGQLPKEFTSEESLKEYIKTNKGVLSYASIPLGDKELKVVNPEQE